MCMRGRKGGGNYAHFLICHPELLLQTSIFHDVIRVIQKDLRAGFFLSCFTGKYDCMQLICEEERRSPTEAH